MSAEEIGEWERKEICERVDRILSDLGNPEPPLNLSDVRRLLELDLQFYNSSDPGIVADLTHRFTLFAKKAIPDIGKRLLTALSQSRLCAFWVPDGSRILIDSEVPKPKQRWIEGHEITHSIASWHKDFLLGDNVQTLDPACHAILEAEANYGAGRLLFMNDRFAEEARDLEASFNSIKRLSKRYGNSVVSTFWRIVEERDPSKPVFGMVSIHPHHPEIGKHSGTDPWRYFIRSDGFQKQFGTVKPSTIYDLIRTHARRQRTGPVLSQRDVLDDVSGNFWEFHLESFSTSHALLTLGHAIRQRPPIVQAGITARV